MTPEEHLDAVLAGVKAVCLKTERDGHSGPGPDLAQALYDVMATLSSLTGEHDEREVALGLAAYLVHALAQSRQGQAAALEAAREATRRGAAAS